MKIKISEMASEAKRMAAELDGDGVLFLGGMNHNAELHVGKDGCQPSGSMCVASANDDETPDFEQIIRDYCERNNVEAVA